MRQQKFQNIHQLFEISSGRLQGFYEKNTSGRRGKASQYLKQLGVPHRRVSVEYHFGDIMPYTASEYARYWTVAFFQKVAFLKIKYAAHPVSLENRLETLPQTYAYCSTEL